MTPASDNTGPESVARRILADGWLAAIILVAAAALRAPHLSGPIDDPHSWRQADTAALARTYYEDGIDLLEPSVVWLGPHRTLALELPAPEALMALAYGVAGGEHLTAARLVSLVCFLAAGAYLFALLRRVFDPRCALFGLAIFCVQPLGLFYSRALHADPLALCASAGWLYHALRGYDEGRPGQALVAGAWAVIAAVVKVPYLAFLALPAGAWIAWRFDARQALRLVLCGLPSLLALAAWRAHVETLAAAVPDYGFVPGFAEHFAKHMQGSAEWYYGTLAQRSDPSLWRAIGSSVAAEVATPIGLGLLALTVALAPLAVHAYGARSCTFLATWVAASLLYVLVFFNLNLRHDYYQLPLLAPVAASCAVGLESARRLAARVSVPGAWLAALGVLALLAVSCVRIAARRFYVPDTLRLEAGAIARRETPDRAVLVAGVSNADAQNDDPRLLYYAHRLGWAVVPETLEPAIVERLRGLGATHVFVVLDGPTPPGIAALASQHGAREVPLTAAPWRSLIVDLASSPGAPLPTRSGSGALAPDTP